MARTSTADNVTHMYLNREYIGQFCGLMFLRDEIKVKCWNSCLTFTKRATKPMITITLKFAYFDYTK